MGFFNTSLCLLIILLNIFVIKIDSLSKNKKIRNIKTGYKLDDEQSMTTLNPKKDKLKTVLDQRYQRLRCGYAYSGLLHLQASLILFDSSASEGKILIYLQSYSNMIYDMMAMFLMVKDVKNIYDELWFLYMYVSRVKYYKTTNLVSVDKVKDQSPIKIELRNILYVHHYVIKEMQKFLNENYCDPRNAFNVDSPHSVFYDKYKIFNKCRRTGTCDVAKIVALLNLNSKTMEDYIKYNAAVVNMPNNYKAMYLPKKLYLNNAGIHYSIAFEKICDKMNLNIIWNDVFENLKKANELAITQASPVDRFEALKYYHDMFIEIVQLIMFRIMWRNMIYVCNNKFPETPIETVRKNYEKLTNLLGLELKKNKLYDQLCELELSKDESIEHLNTVASRIIDEIVLNLKRLSKKLNCDALQKFYINPAKDNDCISLKKHLRVMWSDKLFPIDPKSHKNKLLCGGVFIKFLKLSTSSVHTNSFISVTIFHHFFKRKVQ